jgi:hypothetical protein
MATVFGATALYLEAQPPPPRTTATTLVRTVRKPIGTPRIRLELVPRVPQLAPEIQLPGVCAAPLDVRINVASLGLDMRTEKKAVWYSLVDTIPPVGHTASITIDPVNLLEGDRKVGTLVSGEVKFREVVSDIPLTGTNAENEARLRAMLSEFDQMTPDRLKSLSPISMKPYELPAAGVQVMRAQLEETYEIDGVGRDTVVLRGWIAVTHGEPKVAQGETELTWNTAVIDTEFVGLDLRGESDVFGPIRVTLDPTRPSRGQVGRIEIPELAQFALVAKLKKEALGN